MIAERRVFRVGTYNNGQPYLLPRGRYAPRGQVEDRLAPTHVVVDLDCERPVATKFLGQIVRELRIRFYKAKTSKSYRCALAGRGFWPSLYQCVAGQGAVGPPSDVAEKL